MNTIKVEDVQRDPLGFLHRVEQGETLVVLRGGSAIAEIKPLTIPPKQFRPYGLAAGQFVVPDNFNHPLPDEVVEEFERP